MTTRYTFRGMPRDSRVRAFGERCLQFALGRFAADIRDIHVVLEDCNGPRGGVDKRCGVELYLHRGGRLQAGVRDTTCESALHRAIGRLRRQMQAAVGQRHQQQRSARGLRALVAEGAQRT